MSTREELIIETASQVHEDWCSQELTGFYKRAQECFKKETIDVASALEKACFKGETKRNEFVLNIAAINEQQELFDNCLNKLEFFLNLNTSGIINVKRFIKRTLTEEEQTKAGEHYNKVTGEENILRNFKMLSADSKKENLEAAIGAFNVYEQLSKAGVSIDQMEHDDEIKNIIGIAIHTDWLKRNMNHPNKSLKVPYSKLDEWTQQQDLTVFGALLKIVKSNLKNYYISQVDGVEIPDYINEEANIFNKR